MSLHKISEVWGIYLKQNRLLCESCSVTEDRSLNICLCMLKFLMMEKSKCKEGAAKVELTQQISLKVEKNNKRWQYVLIKMQVGENYTRKIMKQEVRAVTLKIQSQSDFC